MRRPDDDRPVVVAYDGSEEARAAVREAVGLFAGRKFIVVTVWEPGLEMALASFPGVAGAPPSVQSAAEIARGAREETNRTADAGATLARELAAQAEAVAIADSDGIASTIVAEAARHRACAVVVGSRGLGHVKAQLLGSTSQGVLRRADRPVVVIRRLGDEG
jgi:nucleotide-binding universal stress UspA family protein